MPTPLTPEAFGALIQRADDLSHALRLRDGQRPYAATTGTHPWGDALALTEAVQTLNLLCESAAELNRYLIAQVRMRLDTERLYAQLTAQAKEGQ